MELDRFERRTAEFVESGAPADLAAEVAGLLDAFSLLDICEIAASSGETPELVAELYFALSERFEVDRMLNRITQLPREDRWSALARMSLRYDLYSALALLTRAVQRAAPVGRPRQPHRRLGGAQRRGTGPDAHHPRRDHRQRLG